MWAGPSPPAESGPAPHEPCYFVMILGVNSLSNYRERWRQVSNGAGPPSVRSAGGGADGQQEDSPAEDQASSNQADSLLTSPCRHPPR